MTTTRLLLTLSLTLALGMAAFAVVTPSFLGPTGMLLTPTADFLQHNQYNALIYGTHDSDSAGYAVNYGVVPNVEAGFTRLTDRETIVNAKYTFQPETKDKVGFAFGVIDLTNQVSTSLYAVASRHFPIDNDVDVFSNLELSAGLAGGANNTDVPVHAFFGSASVDVQKIVTLMVEYDGSNINYGARGQISKGFGAQIGILNPDSRFTYGLTYTSPL